MKDVTLTPSMEVLKSVGNKLSLCLTPRTFLVISLTSNISPPQGERGVSETMSITSETNLWQHCRRQCQVKGCH